MGGCGFGCPGEEATGGGGGGVVDSIAAGAAITVAGTPSVPTVSVRVDNIAVGVDEDNKLALVNGGVALTKLATQAASTVVANLAGSSASPTAVVLPALVAKLALGADPQGLYLPGSTHDRYAMPGLNTVNTRATVAFPAANVIYAVPFSVPKPVTVDRLGVRLVTQSGTSQNMRIGIWEQTSASNEYPSALVVDSGNIPCSSDNSTTGFKAITVSAALVPGVKYWIGIVASATPSIQGSGLAQALPVVGIDNSGTLTQGCISVAFTYGALTTFPASGAASQFNTGAAPILYYRANAT